MSKYRSIFAALLLWSGAAAAADAPVGRAPTDTEMAAWDTDIRPDGKGAPKGKGTVKQGEALYQERCASCHGEFGEGVARWPELAGGFGSLADERPLKTVGSYWPYVSTLVDYIQRAMPFGNARSLSPDETYAVAAYVLSLNDIVKDPDFELNDRNLATIRMPNETAFRDDDRDTAEKSFWNPSPCMTDCKPEVRIVGRAAVLAVTPDRKAAPKVE